MLQSEQLGSSSVGIPVPFSEFMREALYGEKGFYSTGGQAGRRGDFVTSPEVGPLFGKVVANQIETWWVELGKPDPFFVIEAGAGRGVLAKSILTSDAGFLSGLRYILVEQSDILRQSQHEILAIEPPENLLGVVTTVDDEQSVEPNLGPLVTSLAEMPSGLEQAVVITNELLDNIPFDVAVFEKSKWQLVCVDNQQESLAPLDDLQEDRISKLCPHPMDGQRIPIQTEAGSWVRDTLASCQSVRLLAFDYAANTNELARRSPNWLRTYREQTRGNDPYQSVGQQDITADVAIDQLPHCESIETQADFLQRNGIEQEVERNRQTWNERASIGDLTAMKARSALNEAPILLDENGLGGFKAMIWSN